MLLDRIRALFNTPHREVDAGVAIALGLAFKDMRHDHFGLLQQSAEILHLGAGKSAIFLGASPSFIAMLVDGTLTAHRDNGKATSLACGTFWNERSGLARGSAHTLTRLEAGPNGCRVLLWSGRRLRGLNLELYEAIWDAVLRSAGRLIGYDIGRKRFIQPEMPVTALSLPPAIGWEKPIYILGPGDQRTPAGRAQDKNNAAWVLNITRPHVGFIINERSDGFYAERLFDTEAAA